MTDEAGEDAKIVAVPVSAVTSLYRDISSIRDLPEVILDQISHFFEHYKDLEKGKWVKIEGWGEAEEAKQEIRDSIAAFEAEKDKPRF
jgi:inorganic pyrophosphatase